MSYYVNESEYGFCRGYFSADEYVMWQGKHSGKLAGQNAANLPYALFFLAFAIFWTVSVVQISVFMCFFGLCFVAVGMYLAFDKQFLDRNTKYVITNRKIYRSRSGKVDMIDLANLPPMRIVEHKGGCGSIYFGESYYKSPGGKPRYGMTFSIDCVDNIVEVQRILSEAIKNV